MESHEHFVPAKPLNRLWKLYGVSALVWVVMTGQSLGQHISTVVGAGTADNVPAISTGLWWPVQPFVDTSGNIYFSDHLNHRVRKVDPSGIITTVAGNGTAGFSGDGGPATSAQLSSPQGMTFDVAGNLYFGETGNNRVRKIGTTGIITTVAGTGTPGYSGDAGPATGADLNSPAGIHLDPTGNPEHRRREQQPYPPSRPFGHYHHHSGKRWYLV